MKREHSKVDSNFCWLIPSTLVTNRQSRTRKQRFTFPKSAYKYLFLYLLFGEEYKFLDDRLFYILFKILFFIYLTFYHCAYEKEIDIHDTTSISVGMYVC